MQKVRVGTSQGHTYWALHGSHQLYSFVVRVSKPRMVEKKLFHAQKYLYDFLLLNKACTLYNGMTVLR
jgi:hypothetical protein